MFFFLFLTTNGVRWTFVEVKTKVKVCALQTGWSVQFTLTTVLCGGSPLLPREMENTQRFSFPVLNLQLLCCFRNIHTHDIQQRQMQDAVAAVTMAAQAAAQAVASLAGQMARPAAPVGAEEADRAGSGGAALTPPVQTPITASTSPPLSKFTTDGTKSVMTSTKGFEASVRKLLKCNAKVAMGKADLQLFAQDTTDTRYPAGIRPFKSVAEMVELDSTLSQCKERDWVFMVTIPVGTSRRSALQKLHREHAMFVRSTDVEALEEQQSTLRGVASLAHFREKCTTALREARAERDSNTARLDFPVHTEKAECVVTERIESEYRNLFDRINKELRAEIKRADDKTKDELKALEKLNASDPEILLDGYIKSVVSKELQHAGVMADDGPVNRAPQENTAATKVVEAIADAKSKKRLFPWRRPGERKGLFVQAKQGQGQRKKRLAKARARTRVRRAVSNTKNVRRQRQGHEAQQELTLV